MARWSAAARPLTHVTSLVSDRAAAPFCARGLPDRSPARTTRAYRSALDELRNITIRTYLYNILYNRNNIIFALARIIYYIIVIVAIVIVVVVVVVVVLIVVVVVVVVIITYLVYYACQ